MPPHSNFIKNINMKSDISGQVNDITCSSTRIFEKVWYCFITTNMS